MRKGSAALVPLMIAIFLLFWVIMFMGNATDNFVKVKNVVSHQDLEERLLSAAMQKKIDLIQENAKDNLNKTEAQIDAEVDAYISKIITANYTK